MLTPLTFLLGWMASAAAASKQPHVLFIVLDDLGFDDVGFRSHQIRTPHIDGFARSGLVLDQYYVQDVCSPSRSTFMTGRYAMHHGVVDWIPLSSAYGLPLNETTLAQLFKRAGYSCRGVGKWHMGFYKWEHTPTFRGFDSFVGFYGGGEDYFKHSNQGAYDFRRDPTPMCGRNCSQIAAQDQGVYSTTVFAEEAVRVVGAHSSSAGPLFLYLAFQGVHDPAQVPARYADAYKTTIADKKRRTFAGMLSAVDEGIGNVTAALAARGMLNDTLIVFTTDNGGPTTTGDGVGARNWPLRGGKHSIWDGGVRGTGVITGAGIVQVASGTASRAAGGALKQYPHLMHGADWLPTLAEAAGLNTSGTLPLDGVSQWAAMQHVADHYDVAGAPTSPPRRHVTLGNSTNSCSWPKGDPRRARYEAGGLLPDTVDDGKQMVSCGFSIRADDTRAQPGRQWKFVRGYGGGPDTWCNSSAGAPNCDNHLVPPSHSVVVVASGGVCSSAKKACFSGHDIRTFESKTTDGSDCCAACAAEPECVGWTHNVVEQKGLKCFIKRALVDGVECGGGISGTNGAAPLPPVGPAPSPPGPTPGVSSCPGGLCLYDLGADPHERTELSALHADVVAEMGERMDAVLASYTQYEIDPSCGPATFGHDPRVGKAWQPWC